MKRKPAKQTVSFIIALIIVFMAAFARSTPVFAASELPPPNTAARHEVCCRLSDSALEYYQGDYSYENLLTLSGAKDICDGFAAAKDNELYLALKTLMSETHSFYTKYSGYAKGSLAYYWQRTDAVLGSPAYTMFYSDVSGDSINARLNREHIWPKSRASFALSSGGADLHHLRPSLESVNTAKSDRAFGFVKDTCKYGYTTGFVNRKECYYICKDSDLFECKDNVKGDVARILLYVYCRWGQPNLFENVYDNLPDFDSDDTKNSGIKVIESLDTLLLWCESDPVDNWEMERNDLTERVQGNRNVFIDFPELAFKMFGLAVPAGMASPTNAGCNHVFYEKERQNATAEADGFFTLRCEKCGNERTRRLAKYSYSDYIKGDISGDKKVNNKDLTRLFLYLTGRDSEVTETALDVNGDGKVNNKDLVRLFRYLSGFAAELN